MVQNSMSWVMMMFDGVCRPLYVEQFRIQHTRICRTKQAVTKKTHTHTHTGAHKQASWLAMLLTWWARYA